MFLTPHLSKKTRSKLPNSFYNGLVFIFKEIEGLFKVINRFIERMTRHIHMNKNLGS